MLTEQDLVLGEVLFLFLILRINERLNNRIMVKGSEVQTASKHNDRHRNSLIMKEMQMRIKQGTTTPFWPIRLTKIEKVGISSVVRGGVKGGNIRPCD